MKHSDLPDYDVTSFVKIAYEVTVSTWWWRHVFTAGRHSFIRFWPEVKK